MPRPAPRELLEKELGASKKLVLEFFFEKGARVRDVFSGNSSSNYVVLSYKGLDIYLFSDSRYFYLQFNSFFGDSVASNKYATSRFLRLNNIATPKTLLYENKKQLQESIAKIKKPVIKPAAGAHGNGIAIGARSERQLKHAINYASQYHENIILQRYIQGEDYRLLFVNYKFVSALHRRKPKVIGDGKSTITELIAYENIVRKNNAFIPKEKKYSAWRSKHFSKISIDNVIRQHGRGFLYKVPTKGEVVQLLDKANISSGGMSEDVTNKVNSELIESYSVLLRSLGLALCGIDVVSKDISAPPSARKTFVIELNSKPGLLPHARPNIGQPRDVGKIVAEAIYAQQKYLLKN